MSVDSKDSAEVTEFLAEFVRLKAACNDTPDDLLGFAAKDLGIKELCQKVYWVAWALKQNERRVRELFAAPVDPKFLAAWRDFEDRSQHVVQTIWWNALIMGEITTQPKQLGIVEQWKIADSEAKTQAEGIGEAFDFAPFNIDQEWRHDSFGEDFVEQVEEGLAAWERLGREMGLDLQGVFRRRALVPFVLVPRPVAARHGQGEKLTMLKNLRQAHDAFVFGAPHAALALMRSIMEAVLRDHYQAEGKSLEARIDSASGSLPSGASGAALHRLRKLANAILHLDTARDEGLSRMDGERLEREIISLLVVLRALIEGAA